MIDGYNINLYGFEIDKIIDYNDAFESDAVHDVSIEITKQSDGKWIRRVDYEAQYSRLQQRCDELEKEYETYKPFKDIIDKTISEIVKGNAKKEPKGILNCFGEGK